MRMSPTRHYALLHVPTANVCDLSGWGTHHGLTRGQGDQIDLNYHLSTDGGIDTDYEYCELLESYRVYDPLMGCGEIDNLLPKRGNNPVRIAILDGGRSADHQSFFTGVTTNDYNVLGTTEQSTGLYGRHGNYIHDIIAGIFYREGMESLLSIDHYRVMNANLEATLFDVIVAFEQALASPTPPNIISMSISFKPLPCGWSKPAGLQKKTLLHGVISRANEQGINVIVSAGNDGSDINLNPVYPASEAELPNLIVVGSSRCRADGFTEWSNRGNNHVDLLTNGEAVKVFDEGCYIAAYGTSFSVPLVVAKAAMHGTTQRAYDHEEVLCKLRSQTDRVDGATYGIVNSQTNVEACLTRPIVIVEGNNIPNEKASPQAKPKVYPNPCGSLLNVDLGLEASSQGSNELLVLDAAGRVVQSVFVKGTNARINTEGLLPGVYWLRYTNQSDRISLRFVKR